MPRGDNEVFISQGGGGGEGAAAAHRALLRAAEKGVAVPSFPGAVGRGKRGKQGNVASGLCKKSERGLQCHFLGAVPGLQDVGLKVLIQQLWEWWGSGVGEWG